MLTPNGKTGGDQGRMADKEHIDMRDPGAWRRTTRWQRYMAKLNNKFGGDTGRILEHLEWKRRLRADHCQR